MQLIKQDTRWVAVSSFEERFIPKDARFRWDPARRQWWTDKLETAAKLAAYATGEVLAELAQVRTEQVQAKAENVVASRASDHADLTVPAPDGLAYLPYQRAGIAYCLGKPGALLADDMGLGKGLPLFTPVATPAGWRSIGDLKVSDRVIGRDGMPTRVTGVYPQGKRPTYLVSFTDGYSIECDDAHLWSVKDRNRMVRGKEWLTINTEELSHKPVAGNYAIPRVEPVLYSARTLPIDPYLLGVLIGDGFLMGTSLAFSAPAEKQEIADRVAGNLAAGYSLHPHNEGSTSRQFYLTRNGGGNAPNIYLSAIRSLDLDVPSGARFIPAIYLTGSICQRLDLLRGLMDTDGSSKQNRITFHTTSEKLANDVGELVQSLGGTAIRRFYDRSSEGKSGEWQVNVQLDRFCPFYLTRKASGWRPAANRTGLYRYIESVKATGEMAETVCIAVDAPDSLYVVQHYIVTHNTIQAIGVINGDPSIKRVLVICPNTLKINWRSEMRKWLVEPKQIGIVFAGGVFPNTPIVIINYDIVSRYRPAIDRVEWDLLIADEAHALKSSRAQRTKAVLGGGKKGDGRVEPIQARRRLMLTGTPILNRPAEIWTLIHALDPRGIGGDFWRFHRRYCNAHQTRYGWDMTGASNLDELQRVLRESVMVRRLKNEVLTDLPAKRRQLVEISPNGATDIVAHEMTAFQRANDRLAEIRARVALADAAEDEAAYKAAVDELRAAQGVMFTEMSKVRHETAVAKIPYVIEHLKEAVEASGKVVLFAHHLDVIQAIAAEFGSAAVTLTGQTNVNDRQAAVDRFQNDPTCTLFVGNILAAGVGITLTASSHVVFAELDWRPAMITQAEDRTHRIGQKNSVLVQHLVFDGSLDAKMAKTIVDKQSIIDAALDVGMAPPEPEIEFDLAQATQPATQSQNPPRTAESVPALAPLAPEQVEAVLTALRRLAAMDTDNARELNGVGFSKVDTIIGKDLAMRSSLSVKQAHLGRRIARKYRRQIGDQLVAAMGA